MTTDQLWVGLATALNAGDEQAARQLLDGTDRATIEALLLTKIQEDIAELRIGAECLLDYPNGKTAIGVALQLYGLDVA